MTPLPASGAKNGMARNTETTAGTRAIQTANVNRFLPVVIILS